MMNYQIEWIYEKGVRPINEDAYIISQEEGLFAVIDGATGLGGLPGSLAATTIKETIEKATSFNSLFERTIYANQILGQKTKETAQVKSIDEIPKEKRSSCGIAAIKINQETMQFEFVHAGDCMLFLELENGDIRTITYDYISSLDTIAISKYHQLLKEASKAGVINEEISNSARMEIQDILVQNRRMLNTFNGYGILDGSDEVVHFIEHGTISLNRVKKILLLSDGLGWPIQKAGGQDSWGETAKIAFKKGVKGLFDGVNQLEQQDPFCLAYPRLKKSDDKSGILISLNHRQS